MLLVDCAAADGNALVALPIFLEVGFAVEGRSIWILIFSALEIFLDDISTGWK